MPKKPPNWEAYDPTDLRLFGCSNILCFENVVAIPRLKAVKWLAGIEAPLALPCSHGEPVAQNPRRDVGPCALIRLDVTRIVSWCFILNTTLPSVGL